MNLTVAGTLNVWIDGASLCASTACGYVVFNGVPVLPSSAPVWGHSQIKIVVPDPASSTVPNTVQVFVGGVGSNVLRFLKPVPDFSASDQPVVYQGMQTAGGQVFQASGGDTLGSGGGDGSCQAAERAAESSRVPFIATPPFPRRSAAC